MSVIIRLQNLPWSANSMDIRNYFTGLSIPEGGVHIVGGEQGDAFIAFSTDEDARQAMMNDGGKIKEVKIKLLLSSRNEMQKVIEQARQTSMNFQTMIQQPAQVTAPVQPMGMMNSMMPPQQQQVPVTTHQTGVTVTPTNGTPVAQQTQQNLAQKDWQGVTQMPGMAQMPGMLPMPPNALGMMGMNPAYFAQMAQMGLLNPMAMAQFFAAQGQKPTGDTMTGLQQTPGVHPVFSQTMGMPGSNTMLGMSNQMGGPGTNTMPTNMSGPNMGGGPNNPNMGPNPMMGGMSNINTPMGNQMGGPNSMGPGGLNSLGPGGPNSMVPGPNSMGPGGPNSMVPGPNSMGPGPNSMGSGPNSMGPGPNSIGPGSTNVLHQAPAPPTITQADRSRREGRKHSDDDDVKILEDTNKKRSRSNSRDRGDRRRSGPSDRRARSPGRSRARSSRSRSRERRRRERSRERREKERGGKRKSRSRSRERSSRWNKNQDDSKGISRNNQQDSRNNQQESRNNQQESSNNQQDSRKDSTQETEPKPSGPDFNKSFTVLTPNLAQSLNLDPPPTRPLHVPFSNIDTKLKIDKWNKSVNTPEPNTCLEVRNVPLNIRYTDIKSFFAHYPLYHDGIKIIHDNNGRRTGILYVQFYKADVKQKALQDLNGSRMLDSQVELLPISDDIFAKAVDSFRPPRPTLENAAPVKPAPILIFKVMGLPSNVQRSDISTIFEGMELETIRVNRDDPNKTVAFVKIKDANDALKFISIRKTHMLADKPVLVVPCFEAEFSEAVKKFPDEPDPIMTDCVLIKNLPRTATDRDVCDFFSDIGLVPLKIHLMFTAQGEPSGDVFCEFQNPEEANKAVNKNDSLFGRNTVSVLLVTRQTLVEALGIPLPGPSIHQPSLLGPGPMVMGPDVNFDPRMERPRGDPRGRDFRPIGNGMERMRPPYPIEDMYDNPRFGNYLPRGAMRGRGRGRGGYDRFPRGPEERPPHNGRPPLDDPAEADVSPDNFGKPGCVLALENIPYRASMDDILGFFSDFSLTRENIIRRYDEGGRATGDARVCLISPSEAQRALHTLNQVPLFGRNVFISLV